MATEWTRLAKARTDFADMIDEMTDEQLAAQSLCTEWSAADVAGHIVSLVELSPLKLAMGAAKNRKDVDGFLSTQAKQFASQGASSMSQILRAKAAKQLKPFPEASMVSDTAVHTLDVRRPLGITTPLDPAVLRMALDYSAGELEKAMEGRETPMLNATDIDWSWGTGPEVSGTAETLLLAMNQRDVFDDLEGEGISLLPT